MRGQGNSVLKINSEIPSVSKTCTNRGSVTCSQAVIITLGDGFLLLVLLQHVSKENGVLKSNNAQDTKCCQISQISVNIGDVLV